MERIALVSLLVYISCIMSTCAMQIQFCATNIHNLSSSFLLPTSARQPPQKPKPANAFSPKVLLLPTRYGHDTANQGTPHEMWHHGGIAECSTHLLRDGSRGSSGGEHGSGLSRWMERKQEKCGRRRFAVTDDGKGRSSGIRRRCAPNFDGHLETPSIFRHLIALPPVTWDS